MASTISQKLKIKEGDAIVAINAPADYKKSLGPLPAGAKVIDTTKSFNQVHWFVKDKAQMEKELRKVMALVRDQVICWVFYPKGTSKIQTDLTRDKGWDALLKHDIQWITLVSFDDTWSAFSIRQKSEADKKKDQKPKERPIFDYVDPKTKTVKLPDDFEAALKKNKSQQAFFNALPFSHKKEYVEWIITAKREETRNERIKKSIERLSKEWKNPSNR